MNVKFPYGFDFTGSTAQDNLACHIRDMVEQILLTSPGERVNLPTFGSGTATLVFKPNSNALAAAQQQAVQGASLQMWLSDLIKVHFGEGRQRRRHPPGHGRVHDHPKPAATNAAIYHRRSVAMIYFCTQKFRRALVLKSTTLNGIDYLEVGGEIGGGKQLLLTLLHDARTVNLSLSQIVITGGAADAQVKPVSVSPGTNDAPFVVTIELDQCGDFSPYTLSLIAVPGKDDPPDGFDPQLSQVSFSFKAGCPTIGDCLSDNCCPPDLPPEPDINYLAKDYLGFRQVMLDRMAVLTSTWTETHVPDIGVMLVELLAYVADHLSYQQDAVGTEAYIGTARSRISLRRHARLVDYKPSEGCNARAWIYMQLDPSATDGTVVPPLTQIFPRVPGLPPTLDSSNPRNASLLPQLLQQSAPAFSIMSQATLWHEQNEIQFYTWSDTNCCLGSGSTHATLIGTLSTLKPGTVLIFEEVIGPETGDPDDANPANRWAVMLTKVRITDYKGGTLVDPLNGTFITKIYWGTADALPFPLCISSTTDAEHGQKGGAQRQRGARQHCAGRPGPVDTCAPGSRRGSHRRDTFGRLRHLRLRQHQPRRCPATVLLSPTGQVAADVRPAF